VYAELRGERGYFGLLAVDPKRQRRGLGGRLIAAAEDYCRTDGCRFVDLTFVNVRQELPGYYQHFGYAESGVLPFPPDQVPNQPGILCKCPSRYRGCVLRKALRLADKKRARRGRARKQRRLYQRQVQRNKRFLVFRLNG